MNEFDALFLVSFGGPEGPDDVMPFLENVLRGKNVPEARKLEVAENYHLFGGVSPINGFMRDLRAKLKDHFDRSSIHVPIYWGNRNWPPFIADALSDMKRDGIKNALAFVTSAYSSYSGCRQYREDIERAREELSQDAPHVAKIRAFYNHPYFIQANVENIKEAMASLTPEEKESHRLVFTAHSIPVSMSSTSTYEEELKEAASLVAAELQISDWTLAYQSRSGPPTQPWLEPAILEVIEREAEKSTKCLTVSPIGFVSDHMEVIFDLDVQAQQLADRKGIRFLRAKTAGHHPLFVDMIADLVLERMHPHHVPKLVGSRPIKPNVCPPDCCQIIRTHR